MYRKVDIPKQVRVALIMLIAFMMLALQQYAVHHSCSETIKSGNQKDSQLTLKLSAASISTYGIVHEDSAFSFAILISFTFVLFLLPIAKEGRVYIATPAIFCPNFCCIVPNGP
jgi:hypothetical protein